MILSLKNVNVGYGKKRIVYDATMEINQGEVVCLLGPNGSGKTTLFKAVLGLTPVQSGEILLDKINITNWKRNTFARSIAYVPQLHVPSFPYTVLDVVCSGRIPYLNTFSVPGRNDKQIAESMLERLSIGYLKKEIYTEISGGERQMVLIARALTQEPAFIVMDEPTAHLDYGNQIRTLTRIMELADNNIGVILTTHNPEHVFMCADKVAALLKGKIIATGIPEEVITKDLINKLYGVNVVVTDREIKISNLSQGRLLCMA